MHRNRKCSARNRVDNRLSFRPAGLVFCFFLSSPSLKPVKSPASGISPRTLSEPLDGMHFPFRSHSLSTGERGGVVQMAFWKALSPCASVVFVHLRVTYVLYIKRREKIETALSPHDLPLARLCGHPNCRKKKRVYIWLHVVEGQ